MIASCGFLDNELSQFSKEEEATLADNVETLGVDLRIRVKRLGAKEKARRKKCKIDVLDYQEEWNFPKKLHEGGCQEVITSGHGTSKNLESSCSGRSSNGKIRN